jgi:hypothetical protein
VVGVGGMVVGATVADAGAGEDVADDSEATTPEIVGMTLSWPEPKTLAAQQQTRTNATATPRAMSQGRIDGFSFTSTG